MTNFFPLKITQIVFGRFEKIYWYQKKPTKQ